MILSLDSLLRHHFSKADSSKDSKINAVEINRFLASMNLKLKKDQIEALIQVKSMFILLKEYKRFHFVYHILLL